MSNIKNINNFPFILKSRVKSFCIVNPENKSPIGSKVNDSSSFMDFDEALKKALVRDLNMGINLNGDLCGIDIDHCIDSNGIISDYAKSVIDYLDTYTEKSPSGTGIHAYLLCSPEDQYDWRKNGFLTKNVGTGLEIYQGSLDNRYFQITGDILENRNHIRVANKEFMSKLFNTYMPKKASQSCSSTPPCRCRCTR